MDEHQLRTLRQSIDAKHFIQLSRQWSTWMDSQIETMDDIMAAYLAEDRCRTVSPNPLFDESWYRLEYEDIQSAINDGTLISGFYHFVQWGVFEGRSPTPYLHLRRLTCRAPLPLVENADFDANEYLELNPEARLFIEKFPHVKPLMYHNNYGRYLGASSPFVSGSYRALRDRFDPEYYRSTYMADLGDVRTSPFDHYITEGRRQKHRPNVWFDEEWYLAFYKDVRLAVEDGQLLCGFHHYVMAGQKEGRIPEHVPEKALESVLPGVTAPVLLGAARDLQRRLTFPHTSLDSAARRRFWLILPRLNPDIVFGGYKSLLELAKALKPWCARRDIDLGVILTEEIANRDYLLWRTVKAEDREVFEDVTFVSTRETNHLSIGPRDRFLSYSSWDGYLAKELSSLTDDARPFFLIQEYEPIFLEMNSFHATCSASFELDAYPIFNTRVLRDYFRKNKLGVFAKKPNAEEDVDYATFEHVIYTPPEPPLTFDRRGERTLALYARPERHAARNLYEIAELALRRTCQEGVFGREWNFIGLGALSELPDVELSDYHRLRFVRKMDEDKYREFNQQLDIGLSLMYAPHPSVVPFEFAATGAIVVTNTFSGRPAKFFERLSPNFVVGEPTVDGIAEALRVARRRADESEQRIENRYRPDARSWSEVFSVEFLDRVFGARV